MTTCHLLWHTESTSNLDNRDAILAMQSPVAQLKIGKPAIFVAINHRHGPPYFLIGEEYHTIVSFFPFLFCAVSNPPKCGGDERADGNDRLGRRSVLTLVV